jgi:hypothetical protein
LTQTELTLLLMVVDVMLVVSMLQLLTTLVDRELWLMADMTDLVVLMLTVKY